jgi:hypothetical protein
VNTELTVAQFCAKHNACDEGREWAIANCKTMAEVWAAAKPEWLLWVATREGVLTDRELRLLAVWAARQVQHLMTDARSISALDVAERHANGQATDEELAAARDGARAAARDGARAAARAAARDAARAAARDGARASARDAVWASARDAAWDAAWDAARAAARDGARASARDAAWDAAQAKQAAWVRENCKPSFSAEVAL